MDFGVLENCISAAARARESPLMIELDGVCGDIGQRVVREFVLDGVNVACPGLDVGKVRVSGQRALLEGTA